MRIAAGARRHRSPWRRYRARCSNGTVAVGPMPQSIADECHLLPTQSFNVALNSSSELRIANFYRARDANDDDQAIYPPAGRDLQLFQAPGYPQDEVSDTFDARFDILCVAVTLFEMATCTLPDLSLERDALLAEVADPLKRTLIAFALDLDPSNRPTAEELLQKIITLAPPSVLADQFRAQIFVSMEVDEDAPPTAEAKLLRSALLSQGVYLHIVSSTANESLGRDVFDAMAKSRGFLVMATENVRRCVLLHFHC